MNVKNYEGTTEIKFHLKKIMVLIKIKNKIKKITIEKQKHIKEL